MIYVTHDQEEAMTLGDRIAVLGKGGTLEQLAPPLELYDRPDNAFVAEFIGVPRINWFEGELEGHDFAGVDFRLKLTGAPCARRKVRLGVRPHDLTLADPDSGRAARRIERSRRCARSCSCTRGAPATSRYACCAGGLTSAWRHRDGAADRNGLTPSTRRPASARGREASGVCSRWPSQSAGPCATGPYAWRNFSDHSVVLCTVPDSETGARLGRGMVEQRLAARVNIVTGVRSLYSWEGEVKDEPKRSS